MKKNFLFWFNFADFENCGLISRMFFVKIYLDP
jgi:hypothetical protein